MLYPVAHSFLNGQSKNSNFLPLPELHETQFKKNRGALGTRMQREQRGILSAHVRYNFIAARNRWYVAAPRVRVCFRCHSDMCFPRDMCAPNTYH